MNPDENQPRKKHKYKSYKKGGPRRTLVEIIDGKKLGRKCKK